VGDGIPISAVSATWAAGSHAAIAVGLHHPCNTSDVGQCRQRPKNCRLAFFSVRF